MRLVLYSMGREGVPVGGFVFGGKMAGKTCTPKPRVQILDILRGFSVLSMMVYHTLFDVVWMFGHPMVSVKTSQ